jgi:hypothetical protein
MTQGVIEARAWLVSLACDKAKDHGYPHELWTTRLLARHARENAPAAPARPAVPNLSRRCADRAIADRTHERMGVDDQDAEIFEIIVARGRQRQPIADPLMLLVGSGDHFERKRKVGGVPRQRTCHSDPIESAPRPAAIEAAEPPEEPPGERPIPGIIGRSVSSCERVCRLLPAIFR